MKNRSNASRAALAAMVMAVMSMSAVSAEAALRRAPADPIQRVGEGRMRRAESDRLSLLSAMRRVSADLMIRLWVLEDYRPMGDVRSRGSR
ncbi:MAG: hypothetical protein ABIS67_13970 [Candidatus Eisenbacteria bacterium]